MIKWVAISVLLLLTQTVRFIRQSLEPIIVPSGSCRGRRPTRTACPFLFQAERKVRTSEGTGSRELRLSFPSQHLELEMAGGDGGSKEWAGQTTKLQGRL